MTTAAVIGAARCSGIVGMPTPLQIRSRRAFARPRWRHAPVRVQRGALETVWRNSPTRVVPAMGSGIALAVVAAALWGLAPVASNGALAGYSPEVLSVVRLGIAAVLFRWLGGAATPWLLAERWSWIGGIALGLKNGVIERTGVRSYALLSEAFIGNARFGEVGLGLPRHVED
jgi:hypothetical protein